jgi:uncharacterized protein DUF4158
MLKCFQRLVYSPNPDEVPEAVVSRVRSPLGLADGVAAVAAPRSRQRYRDAIREHLGVKPFGDEARRFASEAVADAARTMDDPADLVNVTIEELVRERFELPAFSTLDRLARGVSRATTNVRLFSRVEGTLSEVDRTGLDALLETDAGGRSDLNLLKASPKSATKKNLSELREGLLREGGLRPAQSEDAGRLKAARRAVQERTHRFTKSSTEPGFYGGVYAGRSAVSRLRSRRTLKASAIIATPTTSA